MGSVNRLYPIGMENARIIFLLNRHLRGTITHKEEQELTEWFKNVAPGEFKQIIESEGMFPAEYAKDFPLPGPLQSRLETEIDKLAGQDEYENKTERRGPYFLHASWMRYAAAIVLILTGIAVYIFSRPSSPTTGVVQHAPSPVHIDITAGYNRAVLTLANGRKVELDSAVPVTIRDGELSIENNNGELVYGSEGKAAMNSMVTPKGGQYKLMLADGTKVWLNAASSISFPTAFTGPERRVAITGEAYFEVAKNPSMPFIVSVVSMPDAADSMEVRVLGTHFNINAYPDEGIVRTTVTEGLVMASKSKREMKIAPGEQASVAVSSAIFEKSHPDMEEVLAWKNGKFKFSNTGVASLMRQIARWYDVDIQYEGDLSSIHFSGEISRKDNVENLLEILESEGRVKFTIQGRKITVKANRIN